MSAPRYFGASVNSMGSSPITRSASSSWLTTIVGHFGGDRRRRASAHGNGGDDRAELARERDGDEFDDVARRTVSAELRGRLERRHGTKAEGHQRDDRQCADADGHHLPHRRCATGGRFPTIGSAAGSRSSDRHS